MIPFCEQEMELMVSEMPELLDMDPYWVSGLLMEIETMLDIYNAGYMERQMILHTFFPWEIVLMIAPHGAVKMYRGRDVKKMMEWWNKVLAKY